MKLFSLLTKLFALTSAAALSIYAYIAAFIRPIGDDYCISARLIGYDPLTASLIKYWYTSNRFSNEIAAWFTDLFGPRGVAILAVGSLLLWLAGLTWLLYESARLFKIRWDLWTGILLAEIVALVSYYTAPNLFQSVQWRPGLMTYFLPLVIYSFLFAGIFRRARISVNRPSTTDLDGTSRPSALDYGLLATITTLFFGAFFAGGLSETAGALHISILGLALVVNFLWNKTPTRRAALVLITATLVGALLAMIGMFITPANAIRLDGTATPSMLDVILRSFTYAVQFLTEAARLLKIPLGFTFASGAALAYLYSKSNDFSLSRRAWLGFILIPILTYLLIVAAFAPSAYGQSFPVDRVRFPAHVLLAASLLTLGGLLGLLAARTPLPRWTATLVPLALFVLALYPLWTIRNNYKLIPEYQSRAAQWDARDASIRELAASGEENIVTWKLPGIANVNDLGPRPGHWINYCAAIVYGVDTISASQESP
ncbi:MAG: hypothetical protein C4583_00370 [Anaerolineaceae bacterium]|nr:MAG: hypothetical protein C4583_00370 [Anaerolineaceae bacterium]